MPIEPAERITRFVLEHGHYAADRVKFRAFMPPRDEVVISVGRTEAMNEPDVWQWGDTNVADPSGRTIYARGDFRAEDLADITANGHTLTITPDEPPERHANVIGFPPLNEKELQKSLALQLAAKAACVVRAS